MSVKLLDGERECQASKQKNIQVSNNQQNNIFEGAERQGSKELQQGVSIKLLDGERELQASKEMHGRRSRRRRRRRRSSTATAKVMAMATVMVMATRILVGRDNSKGGSGNKHLRLDSKRWEVAEKINTVEA